ncbi:CHASE3 domain-containing protein [Leptolyngbya sp. 15MV]|nr:CHASE3 domain-containing protein [Leptolyngbya sp. 15MV]
MRFWTPEILRRTVPALALLLIPASLLGVHVLLQSEFGAARELRNSVDEAVETRTMLSDLLALHLDLETGQRGYVLSGNEAFLEPYERAHRQRAELIARLQARFADNPQSAAIMNRLVRNSDRKFAISSKAVADVRAGRTDVATATIAGGEGQRAMDAIRRHVAMLDRLEIQQLRAETPGDPGMNRNLERIVSSLLAVLALLLAVVTWVVGNTARQRSAALARARQLSERQGAMFDGAVDGMMLLDGDGNIVRINPSIVRMFGYSRAELVGRHNTQLMETPFDLATSKAWLDQVGVAGIHGAGRKQEFTGRRRNGTTFPTEVAISRVSDDHDRRFVAAVRDISAFKHAEQLKNEFVSTVSHELRTPLTSIAGSLGLLSAGAVGPLDEKASRLIAIAHSNCQRLIRLINDMLDIEKIESGKMTFAEEEVDVGALIDWTVAANRGFAEAEQVALAVDSPVERVLVRGDADRLEQLLTNLVSNAIKHSPRGETVDVVATVSDSRVAIAVMDRGPGIPEDFRDRIFGKFAMADSSDSRTKGGTGLGLSIAREIARKHGGRIGFEDRPGGGTIFRAELPILTVLAQQPRPSRKLPTVLHVDDDRDCLSVVASAFQDRAEVVTVASLDEARRTIADTAFDGAIIDIGLRDGNGGSLVEVLRRKDPGIPVVLFSAIDEPHGEFGADAVLIKSRSSLDDLVAATMDLLRERGNVTA